MIRSAVVIAIAVVVILAAYWTLLFFVQRSMLFPKPPLSATLDRPRDAEQIWLATSFGKVEAWYLRPAAAPSAGRRPLPSPSPHGDRRRSGSRSLPESRSTG